MGGKIVRARLDEPSERALATLVGEGRTESGAVRLALVEAARRRQRSAALVEEVRRLADDPVDIAARRAVMNDLDAAGTDWPA